MNIIGYYLTKFPPKDSQFAEPSKVSKIKGEIFCLNCRRFRTEYGKKGVCHSCYEVARRNSNKSSNTLATNSNDLATLSNNSNEGKLLEVANFEHEKLLATTVSSTVNSLIPTIPTVVASNNSNVAKVPDSISLARPLSETKTLQVISPNSARPLFADSKKLRLTEQQLVSQFGAPVVTEAKSKFKPEEAQSYIGMLNYWVSRIIADKSAQETRIQEDANEHEQETRKMYTQSHFTHTKPHRHCDECAKVAIS